MTSPSTYRGRFAPTPSGALHLGSLLTAVASHLQARSQGGAWLLRIDDLDRARCPPGLDAVILRQLESHALHWDEPVRYQTASVEDYRAALERLDTAGLLYACACTRAQLRAIAQPGRHGAVYAGTCREAGHRGARVALRLRAAERDLAFDDGWQGPQSCDLAAEIGDFVVRRSDGAVAYQLACAVDEHAQRITEVARGADLLGSTFQQLWVQHCLDLGPPRYRHLPVLVDAAGRKLSKQNRAPAVDGRRAAANLVQCLRLLCQEPPTELAAAAPAEIVAWGAQNWAAAKIPRTAQIAAL